MDEQAKKINEAIGEERRTMDLYGYAHTRTRNALDDLLRLLPVEGWPEQLPTSELMQPNRAVFGTIDDVGGGCVSVLVDRDTAEYPVWGERVCLLPAAPVEPPKPSTERVPWWKSVGRTIGGNRITTAAITDTHGGQAFLSGGVAHSRWVSADADDMVEVEVLDTETGAPE